jgi:hypothetical protein
MSSVEKQSCGFLSTFFQQSFPEPALRVKRPAQGRAFFLLIRYADGLRFTKGQIPGI